MLIDRVCFDVAERILDNELENPTAMETALLAHVIQTEVERWIALRRANYARLREGTDGGMQ